MACECTAFTGIAVKYFNVHAVVSTFGVTDTELIEYIERVSAMSKADEFRRVAIINAVLHPPIRATTFISFDTIVSGYDQEIANLITYFGLYCEKKNKQNRHV
jgi:hypothetical protein